MSDVKDALMNGLTINQPTPTFVDQGLVTAIMGILEMAKRGEIIAMSGVTVGPQFQAGTFPFVPPNPAVIQISIGALYGLQADLNDQARGFRQKAQTSPILHPGGFRPRT